MGCDIHIWAETHKKGQETWEIVGKIFKNPYYSPERESDWNQPLTDSPWDGRNYNLFAILADVRNGRGFAGVDTGDGFNIIAEPKGVPEDASDFYKARVQEYGEDGHSHSYFTLKELLAFDWTQTTKHRGWVDVEQYKIFKAKGKPESWSGGVSGGMVEHVSNQELDRRIKENEFSVSNYYTLVEWEEPYSVSVGNFLTETIPALQKLAKGKGVDDVRIVFYFDN